MSLMELLLSLEASLVSTSSSSAINASSSSSSSAHSSSPRAHVHVSSAQQEDPVYLGETVLREDDVAMGSESASQFGESGNVVIDEF
jgi:hypothetical protein